MNIIKSISLGLLKRRPLDIFNRLNSILISAFSPLLRLSMVSLLAVTLTTGCSKDKDKESQTYDLGEVNITVTGDLNGTFKGVADFDHLVSKGGNETWSISTHDIKPQTFSMSIMVAGNEWTENTIGRPEPGTYSIGGINTSDYQAGFDHIVDQDYYNKNGKNASYSTIWQGKEESGTLLITSSTENTVKGTFDFIAHQYDEDTLEQIATVRIKGDFTANKRVK